MKKYPEIEGTFEAQLVGEIRITVKQPAEIRVSKTRIGNVIPISEDPFWAYTPQPVEKIRSKDVMLRDKSFVPLDPLKQVGKLVIVRMFRLKNKFLPVIDLDSLIGRR